MKIKDLVEPIMTKHNQALRTLRTAAAMEAPNRKALVTRRMATMLAATKAATAQESTRTVRKPPKTEVPISSDLGFQVWYKGERIREDSTRTLGKPPRIVAPNPPVSGV